MPRAFVWAGFGLLALYLGATLGEKADQLGPFGRAGLGVLALYLAAFAWMSVLAARAAGRSIWLLGRARGRDRWAAQGFRAAFVLAFYGPLLWLAAPWLHEADPLWSDTRELLPSLAGHLVMVAGAMLAFAAQASMGASWRVGVEAGEVGALVTGGLHGLSRNPTFLGQLLLLAGLAVTIPSLPTVAAALLFWASAETQVRSEERLLAETLGEPYRRYKDAVPRWVGRPARRYARRPAP